MAALLMLLFALHTATGSGIRALPGLPEVFYTQPGDINIGVIIPVHRYDTKTFCSSQIREMGALQRVEAIVFAINQINQREDILPNVTLGFTIMDDCSKDTTALVRALHLIQGNNDTNNGDSLRRIDVVGVIGSESSRNTVQMSDLLSLFQIPVLSYISTSPVLSNKYVHSYFSRIVPADTLQAKVIVDMVKRFGWSYVSIIYAEGSYGGEGYRAVKAGVEEAGFCLAVIREMRQSFKDADYDDIVRELMGTPRGRVVVIFAPLSQTRAFVSSAKRHNASGQFTWIGSDAWGRNIQDYHGLEEDFLGALTIKFYTGTTVEFDNYFKNLTPLVAAENPWYKPVVELEEDCSFNETSNKPKCSMNFCFASSGSYRPETTVPLVIDAVYTYAHALHAIISQCQIETMTSARDCVTSEHLLREIRNVSFEGENGLVSIDQNGDGVATYEVQNLQKIGGVYTLSSTGLWNSYRKEFTRFDHKSIMWKPSVLMKGETWPTSTCSDDCPIGHQAVRTQPHCCWYCQKCRNNERTIIQDDLPQCRVCPSEGNFYWPDSESRTRCEPIEPTFIGVHDFTGIIIVAVDIFTIIVAIFVTSMFIKNNKEKLIKASSRELSYLILIGIFISSVFVGTLAYRPNDITCNVTYIGFHLSFTMTYAPLTVKTNRVYRIFKAGKKSKVRPVFVNSRSQIFFTILILVAQTLIVGIWVIIDTPRSLTLMPSFSEKYVEITCKLPETGFLVAVGCNLTLVLVCTFYAIKTRKLPDNFNESRFVSFCVYTTIVLWLAFIPTYFTTTKTTLRSLFLAVAMVANSNVTLFFLYIPKLYALYYVSSDAQNLVGIGTTMGQAVVKSANTNIVVPSRP